MEEEDICLPKNHPLQQYLQEIGISDAVSCEISRKSITLPLTTFYQFLSYLKWINPFAFLFNFGFDFPLIRKLLLQNINLIRYSDLITVENKPVVEYVCSTGIKYQIDPTQFRWFSVIFFMLCGLGLNYCTYMTITVLLAILSLLMPNILLLMASKHYLTDTLKQMKKFTQGSRLIVLFLQDLNKRRYFGPKIVDKSAFKIFPLIYHQAHNFMQTYLIGLINFSVRLGDLIDKDSLSMPLEMSTLELFQLKRDLEDKPIDPNIEDLKMFCELLKVLISDILVKLSITFCKRRWSTFHSCMFIFFIELS
ncbi:hypothetical protein MN116_007456 [Schistosoma mekongi]|uniref:Uncharacterized protein n=1 Tax=Schistosoma mekongi TaxID=38744 RepID=A0AAE1ZAT5_SCHME|nr:hypothetical protein MN116_007456 [Schistosoma mekongi]